MRIFSVANSDEFMARDFTPKTPKANFLQYTSDSRHREADFFVTYAEPANFRLVDHPEAKAPAPR